MSEELLSFEPATGNELWRGAVSDVDREVDIARRAWPEWAAKALTFRSETLRRFADRVKAEADTLADLIARETGKPLWEARTEVESVANKVDISIKAYAERTPNRRTEGAMGLRSAVRHKPHGTLAVLASTPSAGLPNWPMPVRRVTTSASVSAISSRMANRTCAPMSPVTPSGCSRPG